MLVFMQSLLYTISDLELIIVQVSVLSLIKMLILIKLIIQVFITLEW